jgi:hypothetical protein
MSEDYEMTPEDWAADKAACAAKAARMVELLSSPLTVDVSRPCVIFFRDGHGREENTDDPTDYEPTIAVGAEHCPWCSEWCGHVFVVMRVVGHPDGRDFDAVFNPDEAERMGQVLVAAAQLAREEVERIDKAAEAGRSRGAAE